MTVGLRGLTVMPPSLTGLLCAVMGLRHFGMQPLWKLLLTPLFLTGLRAVFAPAYCFSPLLLFIFLQVMTVIDCFGALL